MFTFLKTSVLVGIGLLIAEKAKASTIIWNFEVSITTASNTGPVDPGDIFLGNLSYQATPVATVTVPDLELDFFFAGLNIDETTASIIQDPIFTQGSDPSLQFFVDLEPLGFAQSAFFRFNLDNSFEYSLDAVSEYAGQASFLAVTPEPTTFGLLLLGMSSFAHRRR